MEHEPLLDRDIQYLIGRQITSGICGHFINDGFFNIFCCPPTIRAAAYSAMAKLSVFTVNNCTAQIRSSNGKECIRIDFTQLSGYLYLERLVRLCLQFSPKFIKEIYLISLDKIDVPKLMEILEPLRGLTVISLPYQLDICRSRNLERLIHNNATSLVALKHLTHSMSVPAKLKERLAAINSSTLRNGTLDKEEDFYAYYVRDGNYPDELTPIPDKGILLRIAIHRHTEPFRAVRRAGWGNLHSRITALNFSATANFDIDSAKILLDKLSTANRLFPKLSKMIVLLRIIDAYPNNFPYSTEDFENEQNQQDDLVSPLFMDSIQLASFTLEWLQTKKFSFDVTAKVCLDVDYIVPDNENSIELLHKAMNDSEKMLANKQEWNHQMEWQMKNNRIFGHVSKVVLDRSKFEFVIDYKTLHFVNTHPKNGDVGNGYMFRIGHTL